MGDSTRQVPDSFHLLSLTQLIFSALADAYVTKNHCKESFRRGFHLRDGSFDREFLAVSPETHQRAGRVHRSAGNTCVSEPADVLPMGFAEPERDEFIQRLTEGLFRRAAKNLLCRPVKDDNPLVVIHRNDRVHRGTDDAEQPVLALSKGILGSLMF